MTQLNKFVAVIPAYNPGSVVIDVVSRTLSFADKIVLVDDGSNKQNRQYLSQCFELDKDSVELISLDENQGKGHALFEGIQRALEGGCDYIITIDSDGQHNPDEIPRFKDLVSQDDISYDVIIGARKQLSKMPLRSKLGNIFTVKLFNSLFNASIADTQSGFRLLSAEFAKAVLETVPQGKYETEMQILLYAFGTGRSVASMEIETIYLDDNINSKFRPVRDSLRVLSAFLKYVSVAFVSFLTDFLIFLVLTYSLGGLLYLCASFKQGLQRNTQLPIKQTSCIQVGQRVFEASWEVLASGVFYTLCHIFALVYSRGYR